MALPRRARGRSASTLHHDAMTPTSTRDFFQRHTRMRTMIRSFATDRVGRRRIAPRIAPRIAQTVGMAVLMSISGGCHGLLDVSDPTVVQDSDAATAAGANSRRLLIVWNLTQ